MCGTCNGYILLRTIDGMEKPINVGSCEQMQTYRVPYVRRGAMAVMYTAADVDTFPTESLTAYREYRRNRYHEEKNGMPVFDEVVEAPPKPARRIADIDALGDLSALDAILEKANEQTDETK